ncbi:MAG TPA: glycogen/starch/alpha-glucan phosphorylase, partial [Thermodesulfobacteriota bacterium]|nr:glycogen/starch/alpha-glucan phosphorylase [Thermodesulfobacteriota bacterium]
PDGGRAAAPAAAGTEPAIWRAASLGLDRASLERSFIRYLKCAQGRRWSESGPLERLTSLALTVRDRLVERMLATEQRYREEDRKRVYYLSMEFLVGRLLGNNLINLGIHEACRDFLAGLSVELDDLLEHEPDAGLGNGGLGRLAACFLDSLATLDLPGYGYGLRYEYGLFEQRIVDGWQVEEPDHWLRYGNPWEIVRPADTVTVRFFGRVEDDTDARGHYRPRWTGGRTVLGVPYDVPVVGYGGRTVNALRLWSAKASNEFDLGKFNRGDYIGAVEDKALSETISKILYPSDSVQRGQELRLEQEYFFVSCAIQDILRRYKATRPGDPFLLEFSAKVAIQLNDTHPALAIAELMRLLLDEEGLEWEAAWRLTTETFGYTNHTLLPEALESWPVELLARMLPRHLQIIREIDRRFLEEVAARWPGDAARRARMAIVADGPQPRVRMAHLAIVGSHAVNGVAALHSRLLTTELVPDFAALWPAKFSNKTNGVTPRRWLLLANPELAALITSRIGEGWITDLEELARLEPLADDPDFQGEFLAVKRKKKGQLAALIRRTTGVAVDPLSLFDVQVKRIHEYKRQLLNALHILILYHRIKAGQVDDLTPRTFIFAGKAAPGYAMAKRIIRLITRVAELVNGDRETAGRLRVVFVPNYQVSLAERIIPAADLSEQISTAGTEASGTGNMKFAMNGAVTIGTPDGANIEIRERVGPENIFVFGLTADEVKALRASGGYRPAEVCARHEEVRRAVEALVSDELNGGPGAPLFGPIYDSLLAHGDRYFVLADLPAYAAAHAAALRLFADRRAWARAAILNIARIGYFSSDRTVREYARDIWGLL